MNKNHENVKAMEKMHKMKPKPSGFELGNKKSMTCDNCNTKGI